MVGYPWAVRDGVLGAEPRDVRGRLVARERLYEPIMGKRPRRATLRTSRSGHTIPRSRRTDVRHGSRQHPLADSWTGGHHGPALSRSKEATDSHSWERQVLPHLMIHMLMFTSAAS